MADTKKGKDLVSLRLIAFSENSKVTGGIVKRKGDTVDVDKDTAASAVASKRWALVEAEKPAPDGDSKGK